VIYLYCLLPAEVDVSVEGIAAMEEGAPPRLVREGKLQAAVSEVGHEFDEEQLNLRIRDLDWLSPRAVRHHEVVDALYAHCSWLLPLTFGAIFRSEESLRQRLRRQQQDLRARLERLCGREQWDLKLSRDQAEFRAQLRSHSQELRLLEDELTAKPPGTRFLLERKLQNLEARESRRLSADIRTEVHRELSARAVEATRDELVTPAQPQNVRLELRSVYLIEAGSAAGLKEVANELAGKYGQLGYSFELTGPWPAFSFAGGLREALA